MLLFREDLQKDAPWKQRVKSWQSWSLQNTKTTGYKEEERHHLKTTDLTLVILVWDNAEFFKGETGKHSFLNIFRNYKDTNDFIRISQVFWAPHIVILKGGMRDLMEL